MPATRWPCCIPCIPCSRCIGCTIGISQLHLQFATRGNLFTVSLRQPGPRGMHWLLAILCPVSCVLCPVSPSLEYASPPANQVSPSNFPTYLPPNLGCIWVKWQFYLGKIATETPNLPKPCPWPWPWLRWLFDEFTNKHLKPSLWWPPQVYKARLGQGGIRDFSSLHPSSRVQ